MPHLGVPELLIIFAIVVLVFGAGKLPQAGKAIGQTITEFRRATKKDEPKEIEEEEKPVKRAVKPAAKDEAETEETTKDTKEA